MPATKQKYNTTESGSISLGQAGSKYITSNASEAPSSGAFIAITALEAGAVTLLSENSDPLFPEGQITLQIGITIYGRWGSIATDSTSKVIAYYG